MPGMCCAHVQIFGTLFGGDEWTVDACMHNGTLFLDIVHVSECLGGDEAQRGRRRGQPGARLLPLVCQTHGGSLYTTAGLAQHVLPPTPPPLTHPAGQKPFPNQDLMTYYG